MELGQKSVPCPRFPSFFLPFPYLDFSLTFTRKDNPYLPDLARILKV